MMRLYEVSQEFKALQQLSEDFEVNEETGEFINNDETLKALFDEIQMTLEDKLTNTMYIIKDLEISETALKDEAKRLNDKAKVLENKKNRLRELIKDTLVNSNLDKVKTDKYNFSVKDSETLNYDNVSIFGLDSKFIRVKEELNKNEIKAFYKAGGSVEGLQVELKKVLTIR